MAELEQTSAPQVQVIPRRSVGKGFQPGHPKFGGRKKGSPLKRTEEAQAIAARLGFHPVEFMATIALTGLMPNEDGTFTPCDAAMRLDAAKALIPYIVPKLLAAQITGANEGPVLVEHIDLAKILSNPDAAKAARELAMQMALADNEQAQIEAAEPVIDVFPQEDD